MARSPRLLSTTRTGPRIVAAVLAGLCLGLSSGCGAALYTIDVIAAETVVAEAEHAGAPELAPYEYYAAREYLTEAHEEASEASYEDALRYAQIAGRLAREARFEAQRRRDERTVDHDRDVDDEVPGGER